MKILPTIIIEDPFIYSYRVSSYNNFNIKPINILPTLFSLNAVLVIIKRLFPTAKIILQPFNFSPCKVKPIEYNVAIKEQKLCGNCISENKYLFMYLVDKQLRS